MFQASEIKRLIMAGLQCDFIEVEGDDGVHFQAIVVSPVFDGMSTLNQHRAVKATLGSLMGNEIHALGLKTYTPARWEVVRKELDL
ncbi:BolA family protein [Azoarcus taiwanensis]|uniref:BolA/IbaG family iron-sulfur metabolism protein n=1 Tax=Azoarcus taiwanensis TaxID=666964 RepID=A0A972F700_9RHOO|nr:BolA/IbaG family iron-sulfur metabolism protein [Azoarcus taiwanensis]NMG02607.1 BolA/IbaG family iron-sulfur metabolism protein [Azoarcus taiwanensis]